MFCHIASCNLWVEFAFEVYLAFQRPPDLRQAPLLLTTNPTHPIRRPSSGVRDSSDIKLQLVMIRAPIAPIL